MAPHNHLHQPGVVACYGHQVTLISILGQLLDVTGAMANKAPANKPDFEQAFTLDMYMRIVRNKTAYYSFYLPVAAAMLLAGELLLVLCHITHV